MPTSQIFRKPLVKLASLAAVLALGVVVYVAFDGGANNNASPAFASDDQSVARGQLVYAANCAACHGANLEGQPNWRTRNADGRLPAPPHDASGHTWHHDDQTLFDLTKFGLSKVVGSPVETDMPAYEDQLSDDEIRAVLLFIKAHWPATIQKRQSALSSR